MFLSNFKYVWLVILTQVFFISLCSAGTDNQVVTVTVAGGKSVQFTDLSLTEADFTLGASTYDYTSAAQSWSYSNTDATVYSLQANLSSTADSGWTYKMDLTGIGATEGEVSWTSADAITAKTVVTALPTGQVATNGLETLTINASHADFTIGDHSRTFVFTFI